MKTITIKSTFAAIITASTLITTGVAPMNAAHAGGPGGPGVLLPGGPKPLCLTKPWLCGPGGIKLPPVAPVPPVPPAPPAPPAPSAGLTNSQKVGLGILGALAVGAVVANSRKQQVNSGPLNAHLAFCDGKYKTYDPGTNTFMSNAGYRKPCISPYLK
ncbi:MAG: BA14K family protein [Gammaproteobacteria bacterium]|nr:BA14K family protein [Gammaproteobacteria bacterium]